MPVDDDAARALVASARSGDADAFASLFAVYRNDVEAHCRRMLDDAASAEDATAEVFLRARRSFAKFDEARPFRPWLRSVATNYCIDQLRRRRTERALFSAEDLSSETLADDAPGVLRAIVQRQEREEVLEALDRLPAKYRLPLVLRFYQDLDYEEIAGVLDVTRNQVGTLLHRAKRRLREELASSAEPGRKGSDSPRGRRESRSSGASRWPRRGKG